jgi:hypothetical protein
VTSGVNQAGIPETFSSRMPAISRSACIAFDPQVCGREADIDDRLVGELSVPAHRLIATDQIVEVLLCLFSLRCRSDHAQFELPCIRPTLRPLAKLYVSKFNGVRIQNPAPATLYIEASARTAGLFHLPSIDPNRTLATRESSISSNQTNGHSRWNAPCNSAITRRPGACNGSCPAISTSSGVDSLPPLAFQTQGLDQRARAVGIELGQGLVLRHPASPDLVARE